MITVETSPNGDSTDKLATRVPEHPNKLLQGFVLYRDYYLMQNQALRR